MKTNRTIIFVFILGLACLIYGLGKSFIEATLQAPLMILAGFGGVCVMVSIFNIFSGWKEAGLKMSPGKIPIAVLGTVLWFGVMAVLYYGAVVTNIQFDLTATKQHTLDEGTLDLITGLDEKMKFTTFYVGMAPKYVEDLLAAYEHHSEGMIETEIIDPLVDLGYAAQFGKSITGEEKRVIVQGQTERRDIDFSKAPLTENDLNNAIIQVNRPSRTACFLSGHNESDPRDESGTGMKMFAEQLEANNIVSRNIILATSPAVPDDCSVLIVAGPREPLSDEENDRIHEYLLKGGDALFMTENTIVSTPDKPLTEAQLKKNPSLDGILNRWGVKVKYDVVVDLANHASGDVGSPATRNYMAHKAIVSKLDYTFYVRPRSISIMPDRRKTLKMVPIVLTESKDNSWGESNRYLDVKYNEGEDRPGPVPIAFIIVELKEEGDHSDTRIAVYTDADFITNNYIEYYNNAQMGLEIVNWLTETDYKRFVSPEPVEVPRLDLTSKQKRFVVVILLLTPLFVIISGVCVWMSRQKLK